MKKRQLANLIMVAVIVIIAVTGILTVGHIQGWFDKVSEDQAVLTDIRGVLYLEREGVSYPVSSETPLRTGDKLKANPGATAVIRIQDSYLTLGEKAELEIIDPAAEQFSLSVGNGELFTYAVNPVTLLFDGQELSVNDAVLTLSVRSGAQSVSVYSGTVTLGENTAAEGQIIDWVNGSVSVSPLQIEALNNFNISQLRTANQHKTLFFTVADLDQLVADRNQALEDMLDVPLLPSSDETLDEDADSSETDTADETPDASEPSPTDPAETLPQQTEPDETESSGSSQPDKPTSTEQDSAETSPDHTELDFTEAPTTAGSTTGAPSTEAPTTEEPTSQAPTTEEPTTAEPATETEPVGETYYCVLSIRCDTILNNMDNLKPSKVEFVPDDGIILAPVRVPFTEGETVFDVLTRACDTLGIQLEYSWTPIYDSYYIEGINHLYEKDCGDESGWMYRVNGWFPNYGCSSYALADGDVIEFLYTCNGYGVDVGAPPYTEEAE